MNVNDDFDYIKKRICRQIEDTVRVVLGVDVNSKFVKGCGRFEKFFWWQVELDSKLLNKNYEQYTHLLFLPYRVAGNEFFEEQKKCFVKSKSHNLFVIRREHEKCERIWKRDGNNDENIDSFTGNIHVDFKCLKWCSNPKILQVVLVKKQPKQFGCRSGKIERNWEKFAESFDENVEYNVFQYATVYYKKAIQKYIKVPKACHFPEIDDENIFYTLNELVNGIWNKIKKG